MAYKVFVSATHRDLKNHRSRAVMSLQRAGFIVDPMEMWTADSDAPATFSAARLAGCNLCILLIGFRRGDVPRGESRSITQIEYEEALKRGIDVLPFMLEETPENIAGWPPDYDERQSDPGVRAWRREIAMRHGVQTFDLDPASLSIEASIARWVVTTESKRATGFRRKIYACLLLIVAVLMIAAGYAVYAYRAPAWRSHYLSRFLAIHDPNTFNGSHDDRYEVARSIDSLTSLRRDTKLSNEIIQTVNSFDMLANNAQLVRTEQKKNLMDIVKRGGRVRIILWDYSEANRQAYDAFCKATKQPYPEETRFGAQAVDQELAEMRRQILANRRQYPGSLDYRWNQKPLLYTMWIRDWNVPGNALAHLGVHFYRGQEHWPSFRVSRRDGTNLLESMHAEFEEAWSAALIRPAGMR